MIHPKLFVWKKRTCWHVCLVYQINPQRFTWSKWTLPGFQPTGTWVLPPEQTPQRPGRLSATRSSSTAPKKWFKKKKKNMWHLLVRCFVQKCCCSPKPQSFGASANPLQLNGTNVSLCLLKYINCTRANSLKYQLDTSIQNSMFSRCFF